jgi:hypothetical protein
MPVHNGGTAVNINGICNYETPCGWCSKWGKKCDKKIGCDGWLTKEVADNISKVIEVFKSGQYICSCCGKIISPTLDVSQGNLRITMDSADLRGGVGNHILLDHICSDCKDRIGV